MRKILLAISATMLSVCAYAQVTVNGIIGTNEYGNHTAGQNAQGNWYMTWDNSRLYVGITSSNTAEGAVLYVDVNPVVPIDGGTNANGTDIGFNYDNTNFAKLPFRADFVVYFKDGYYEYRTANGSNGWSSNTTSGLTYASNSGTRELSIPWTAGLGGSQPASMAFFGYVTSASGFVYNQMPAENAGGTIGNIARYSRYYPVHDLASVAPFSRNSYVFNSGTNITNFGAIDVYDFTMNTNAGSITRATTGNWNITGTLRVGNGTVSMGANSGTTDIRNIAVGNGTLDLSNVAGAVTNVSGNITNNGTGQLNTFTGTVVLKGSTIQNINMGSSGFAPGKTFYDLIVNNTQGVTAQSDIRVANTITFTNGLVNGGGNFVVLSSSLPTAISGGSASSYLYNGSFKAAINANGVARSYRFPVGSVANYQEVGLDFAATDYTGDLFIGFRNNNPGSGNNSDVNTSLNTQNPPVVVNGTTIVGGLNAGYWVINEDGSSGTPNYSVTLKMTGATNIPSPPLGGAPTSAEQLTVVKADDEFSPWQSQGTHSNATQSISGGVATAVRSGLSSFSIFAIGIGSGNLPVKFVKAVGSVQNGIGTLQWEVADIAKLSSFEIEQSSNGVSFVKVAIVAASANKYNYTSSALNLGGGAYFRIKALEQNGASVYSRIIKLNENKTNSLVVFPNPATSHVNISSDLLKKNGCTINIMNNAGQQVYKQTVTNNVDGNLKINLPVLQKGSYRLSINADNKTETTILNIQ